MIWLRITVVAAIVWAMASVVTVIFTIAARGQQEPARNEYPANTDGIRNPAYLTPFCQENKWHQQCGMYLPYKPPPILAPQRKAYEDRK